MATIRNLPIELITGIFGFLVFKDLVLASWVCHHWRRLARNHLNFWSDIRIDCLSPAALFWARQRLVWTDKRPFSLVVDFPERHVQVERELLDLVCATLGTVRELRITLDSFYAISIYETLLNRAENLEKFSLCLVLGPQGELFELQDLPLPSGIFGRTCGRLRSVSLQNVILTNITPIPAFSAVQMVAITFGESVRYQFPVWLYDYFPVMTWLSLSSGTILFTSASLVTNLLDRFSRLSYLDLSFSGRCTVDVFTHIATANIPEITVTNPNDDAVYAALGPLRSPFHMFCQTVSSIDCEELNITIWSSSTNHVRHFAENPQNYEPGSDNGPLTLFENEAFAAQISSLTISSSVWPIIVPFLPPYTLLKDLRLWIMEWSHLPLHLPQEPLRLPSLDTLLFESVFGDVHITAGEVVAFLERTSSNRVHLRLCRVKLVGEIDALQERTLSISRDSRNELGRFRIR